MYASGLGILIPIEILMSISKSAHNKAGSYNDFWKYNEEMESFPAPDTVL